MLLFDHSNPFPVIDLEVVSYAEQQKHSLAVDEWLGMKTLEVEQRLCEQNAYEAARPRGDKYWIGLPVEALLTPYVELRFMLDKLCATLGPTNKAAVAPKLILDLGAGYGRMGFVIEKHYPQFRFVGIEVVPERVREGADALARGDHARAQLIEGDLTAVDFRLPDAEIYFIYDYGSASAIEKTLVDLRSISQRRPIIVVGRGGATRDAIDKRHAWLSQVHSPQHFAHFSIYRSSGDDAAAPNG